MKSYRQEAITTLHLKGIGLTGRAFNKLLTRYNNFEMTLNERCKLIAKNKDPNFYKYAKRFINI